MSDPSEILNATFQRANANLERSFVTDQQIRADADYVARNLKNLPCNSTTAFLTPALRNRNVTLTKGVNLVGKPPQLYQSVLNLLHYVHKGDVSASDLLAEIVRLLLLSRNERQQRIETLVATLNTTEDAIPLYLVVHKIHFNMLKESRITISKLHNYYIQTTQLQQFSIACNTNTGVCGAPRRIPLYLTQMKNAILQSTVRPTFS